MHFSTLLRQSVSHEYVAWWLVLVFVCACVSFNFLPACSYLVQFFGVSTGSVSRNLWPWVSAPRCRNKVCHHFTRNSSSSECRGPGYFITCRGQNSASAHLTIVTCCCSPQTNPLRVKPPEINRLEGNHPEINRLKVNHPINRMEVCCSCISFRTD